MVGLGLGGLSLSIGKRSVGGGGYIPDPFTPEAPSASANIYGGSQWSVDFGVWGPGITLTGVIEQSDNGTTGWTTYLAVNDNDSGFWPISTLTGKYVRLKVTPSTGSHDYSAVFGPLKQGYTHTVYSAQPQSILRQVMPSWSPDLNGGVWFTILMYYDGSNWSGLPMGAGNSSHTTGFYNYLSQAQLRSTSFLFSAPADDISGSLISTPTSAGWYRCTWYYHRIAGVIYGTFMRNDEEPYKRGKTSSMTIPGTYLSLMGRPSNNDPLYCNAVCDFAMGTGNPTSLHTWLSTVENDAQRSVIDYNFAGDGGVFLTSYIPMSATNPASWTPDTQLVDTQGYLTGPWEETNEGATNTGWKPKVPGFIQASAPQPFIPEAYISPRFGTTSDEYSIQSRKFSVDPTVSVDTWASGSTYAIGQRVIVSGTTYRCKTPHTSGATFAGDGAYWTAFAFTINSLTHSVLGNILPTVTNRKFTCATPGTIAASVTIGSPLGAAPANWAASTNYVAATPGVPGSRVTNPADGGHYECVSSHTSSNFANDLANGLWVFQYGTVTLNTELLADCPLPTAPLFATLFEGNALVCGIEPYPAKPAGTSYANMAALAAAIGTMTAGGTLTVADLGNHSEALTIPPGNYNGLVVQAENLHGVKCAGLTLHGCSNITIKGFAADGEIAVGDKVVSGSGTTGVVIEHARMGSLNTMGVSPASSTFTIRNSLSWDSTVETGKTSCGRIRFSKFKRVVMERTGFGNITNVDVMFVSNVDEFMFNRYLIWRNIGTVTTVTHSDMFQTIPAAGAPRFSGFARNGFVFDDKIGTDTYLAQGMFMTDCAFDRFYFKNVAIRVGAPNNFMLAGPVYNVRIENVTGAVGVGTLKSSANALYAKNVVQGSSGAIMAANAGFEEGTLSLADAGIPYLTAYPDYTTYATSWRGYKPAAAYSTIGASALIAELDAKRIEMGI